MTQPQLAEKMGVSTQTISSYESVENGKKPELGNAIKLAEALNVSIDYLCGKDDFEPQPETKPEINLQSMYDVVKILEHLDDVLICELSHEEINTGKKGSIQSIDINGETLFANIDHVAVIKIHDYHIANFISRKNKIKGLLKGLQEEIPVNDQEDYDAWRNGVIEKLKNNSVKKEMALTWSKEDEQKIKEYMQSLKKQD